MMMMCVDDAGSLWDKGCAESCEIEELYYAATVAAQNYCYRLHHCYRCGCSRRLYE